MTTKMFMIRHHEFDASHRVMHERVKCFNLHGHRFGIDIYCSFNETHSIGYAMDFKEMKRMCLSYIDHRFDHAHIGNPLDAALNAVVVESGWKLHTMNLLGDNGDCNPSAENISKELFFAAGKLLNDPNNCGLKVEKVVFYETPNCWVECTEESISQTDLTNLEASEFARSLEQWRKDKGTLEYDLRRATEEDLKTKDLEN